MIRIISFLLILLIAGCSGDPDNHSGLDEFVGRGSIDGAYISVRGGLASIQDLRSGYIELWLQSPAITVDLDLSGSVTEDWEIVLRNAVRGMTHLNPGGVNISAENQAGTVYRANINASAGSLSLLEFSTTDRDSIDSFSFALLSDIQDRINDLDDIYNRMNSDSSLRFVVSTGDLTEMGSKSELERFRNRLSLLNIPFYTTAGNHDFFEGNYSYWRYLFGRASFMFRYKGAGLIFVDSSQATISTRVYSWLESWLAAGINDELFFITHYPAIDPAGTRNGGFSSRNEAYMLLAMLLKGNVDVILNGHIHSYYHFESGGIDTYISGGGGAYPELYDGVGRHYLRITVNGYSNSYSVNRVDIK